MAGPFANLIRQIRAMAGGLAEAGLADVDLLRRYVEDQSQEAFAEIVRRHGPMVLSVCRRVLVDPDPTEDAFQVVFCVLAKRARTLSVQSLGGWLHGVALKAALRLRAQSHARAAKERQAMVRTVDSSVETGDLRALLDEELHALPSKYREPLILCYLEGKSQDQAALLLGWPRTSMGRWMKQACEALRVRLERRGVALSAGLAAFSQGAASAVPSSLSALAIDQAVGVKMALGDSLLSIADDIARESAQNRSKTMAALLVFAAATLAATTFVAVAKYPHRAHGSPTLFRHDAPVESVVVSRDGKIIAVATAGQGPFLWNAQTGKLIASGAKSPMSIIGFTLSISPDDSLVASSVAGESIRLWKSATGEELRGLASPEANGSFLAFSPDGKLLACSGEPENSMQIWDIPKRVLAGTIAGHGAGVSTLHFLDDHKTIVTGALDKTVRLWEWKTGKERKRWTTEEPVYALSVIHHDQWIVSMSPACLEVFDLASGKRIHRIEDKGRAFHCLAGRDNRIVVGSEKDGRHCLWIVDLDPGKFATSENKASASKITSVAMVRANVVYFGCRDGTVSRVDLD